MNAVPSASDADCVMVVQQWARMSGVTLL